MDHEPTQNIYDDGNIPDSDLPERSGSGQNCLHNSLQNGRNPGGQKRYPYSPEDYDGIDPALDPAQPDLVWVTPTGLLSETSEARNAAPEIV